MFCVYVHSWLGFGLVYWAIAAIQPSSDYLVTDGNSTSVNEEARCFMEYEQDTVYDQFSSAFLFSLETLTTIGSVCRYV